MSPDDLTLPPTPGQRLARGVARALRVLDFVTLDELVPAPGLRVDLMGLGPKGEVWVIECKSGRADFRADQKWQMYLQENEYKTNCLFLQHQSDVLLKLH